MILHFTLLYAVLSQIYALSRVKLLGLKFRLCKKNNEYEVCLLFFINGTNVVE